MKLFKYEKCDSCNRVCRKKGKKMFLLEDPLNKNKDEYLCFYWFLRTHYLHRKVKKSLKEMSNNDIVKMIDSTIGTLEHEQIKQEWENIKPNNR